MLHGYSIGFLLLTLALPAAVAQTASEETPPISCGNRLLAAITCSGDFCDNMTRVCGATPRRILNIDGTPWVSEEITGFIACRVPADSPAPGFITGFACNGSNCDNVAIECVSLVDFVPDDGPRCFKTSSISEESGRFEFPAGMFVISMKCTGRFCDNKEFTLCPLRRRTASD